MAIKSNITANPALVEYGKYVELINDSRFPNTSSYNGSTTLTEYPKYATLSYMVNASDIAISLSAGDLNIGNVGIIDHSSGHDVFVNVIETQTIGGTPVGAALVKTLGTTPVSGGVTVLNPVSSFTLVNPVTAVSITTSQTLPVSGTVTVTTPISTISLGTQLFSFAESPQLDAAGRLRVSTTGLQWYYTPSIDKDGDFRFIEKFVGLSAQSIFVQNLASIQLTSGTELSGSIIRASRRRYIIQPGVSQQYMNSFNWDGQQPNTIKRCGMFTNFNGYFMELSGNQMSVVVRRRLIDGTLVEERVPKSLWNGDKLDGNGVSGENWNLPPLTATITGNTGLTAKAIAGDGYVYNTTFTVTAGQETTFGLGTKLTVSGVLPITYNTAGTVTSINTVNHTIVISYAVNPGIYSSVTNGLMSQSLYHTHNSWAFDFIGDRTNRVRFFKETNYGLTLIHTFNFGATLGTQYENAPSLVIRKEISNTGTVNYLPSLTVSGHSFSTESIGLTNPTFGTAKNNTAITIPNTTKEQPIIGLALRIGEPYQRNDLQVTGINLMELSNPTSVKTPAYIYWRLLFNPGLSGVPASTNVGRSSRTWAYTSTTGLTGSNIVPLLDGYVVSTDTIDVGTALNFLNLGSNIDYTDSDTVVLTVQILKEGTDDAQVVGSLNFIEEI